MEIEEAKDPYAPYKTLVTLPVLSDSTYLLLITAIGAGIRLFFMNEPMRNDESYTYLNFVSTDLSRLFNYPLPNNPVLHSILVLLSTSVFGESLFSIRLPALLCGIAAIPTAYWVCNALFPQTKGGLMASALMAVFPYLILYDTMARGYSLVVLLTLMAIWCGALIIAAPTVKNALAYAVVASLGLFTMPTFLLPLAGTCTWVVAVLLLQRNSTLGQLIKVAITAAAAIGVLTFLLYTPTIHLMGKVLFFNGLIGKLEWDAFISALSVFPFHLAKQYARDIPRSLIALCAVLFVIATISLLRKREWSPLLLVLFMPLTALVILCLQRSMPFERSFIYAVPLALIMVDRGFPAMLHGSVLLRPCLLVLSIVYGLVLMHHHVLRHFPDGGDFPESPALVGALAPRLNINDHLVSNSPNDAPFFFYMHHLRAYGYQGRKETRHIPATYYFIVNKRDSAFCVVDAANTDLLIDIGQGAIYWSNNKDAVILGDRDACDLRGNSLHKQR